MIRATSLGVSLAALGASVVVHAAVILVPLGHAGPSQGPGDRAMPAVEVAIERAETPDIPAPDPRTPPRVGGAKTWPTHTHPYPVPLDHDFIPHDPNLVHPHAPVAAAAPAETAVDDMPSFTIAVGEAAEAYGAVSSQGTAAPHDADADSTPVPEALVDGKARLVAGLAPNYPDAARADGIEGDVALELVVGVSGAVESARVVRGVGDGLDEAALRAVRQFRFAPAVKAGRPVRVRMGWSMQFRLR